ncbi:GNAT family N-acetyltransferase [Aeromicrobium sp. CF4.19]|uniref:GNAT family N-acetyltransferase n=1 Tax=Aeromicrobium sp. CF4.19 TaxID=3373082 RepID=UPI003EE57E8E
MTNKSVTLRPLERDDLGFLAELANDPGVRNRVVGWDWPLARSTQEAWYDRAASSPTERRFTVLNEAGEPIGMTGLWDVDFRNGNAMTALKLGGSRDVRGQGYGAAAVRAIADFAFQDVGLHRLHSTILATNAPSLRVYIDKCGWREEGRLRQHVWRAGKHIDLVQVGILSSEYLSKPMSVEP